MGVQQQEQARRQVQKILRSGHCLEPTTSRTTTRPFLIATLLTLHASSTRSFPRSIPVTETSRRPPRRTEPSLCSRRTRPVWLSWSRRRPCALRLTPSTLLLDDSLFVT